MKTRSILLASAFGSTVVTVFLLSIQLNSRLGLPVVQLPFSGLLGIVLISTGIFIHLSSILLFRRVGAGTPVPTEPPKNLVRIGVYKFVRNPMYLGIFSYILGGFFVFGHLLLLVYAFFFLSAIHLYVVLVEEPKLRERFGQEYLDYTKSVPRWLPRITFKNNKKRK